ncbi:MAG: nitrate reductase molybdenum cofactor assembly chaperone [Myxococcales bacterium]|nr:nitrate reductase molybdenum cofactor assembly chaperone [Myxococcales bacterium]
MSQVGDDTRRGPAEDAGTVRDPALWAALGRCLDYPDETTAATARAVAAAWPAADAPLVTALDRLARGLASGSIEVAEERYTWLFDLKPVCTLNVTHHLFGENYDRGAVMAELNGELARHGLAAGGELPDYLPTLLTLLGRLADEVDRGLLVHSLLVPALSAMVAPLESSNAPWADILRALGPVLARNVPATSETVVVPRKRLEVLAC